MMHVTAVELRLIRMPLREPFEISSGIVADRLILLLRIRDESGVCSWAECVAGEHPNYSYETCETAWLALSKWLVPLVLDRGFTTPGEVSAYLGAAVKGHPMARAALEMAFWNLSAVMEGRSLSKAIGGVREEVGTGISLGIQASPDALAARVERELSAGYQRIKIKIKPGKDIPFVAAAREAAGTETMLTVDANSAYSPDDVDLLRQLDGFGLEFIEQPLFEDDLTLHAELQKELRTPICLDESIVHVRAARDMIRLGSGKVVNIKPGRVGGLHESKSIHDCLGDAGIPLWCGGMLETGIGRAYNVALASLPDFTMPGDLSPSARYWEEDIVDPPWEMDNRGFLTVPAGRPGLGITVNADRVDNLTVRKETL